MENNTDYRLTHEQKQHFLVHGFIKLEDCFSLEDDDCRQLLAGMWTRLNMDPNDKETWSPWRGKKFTARSQLAIHVTYKYQSTCHNITSPLPCETSARRHGQQYASSVEAKIALTPATKPRRA